MTYFYPDPIAAAWMVKHFGVIVYTGVTPTEENVWPLEDLGSPEAWLVNDGWPKFKVHPASEILFKPKEGDIVSAVHKAHPIMGDSYTLWGAVEKDLRGLHAAGRYLSHGSDIKILMRDDLPFMWPGKED